jgi:hypothetical protein
MKKPVHGQDGGIFSSAARKINLVKNPTRQKMTPLGPLKARARGEKSATDPKIPPKPGQSKHQLKFDFRARVEQGRGH